MADRLVVFQNQAGFVRPVALGRGKLEADQAPLRRLAAQQLDRSFADEEWLLHRKRPAHAELVRRADRISILADDDVAFLQAQDARRFQAVGTQPERLARIHKGVPERLAIGLRGMELEAELAGVADPHDPDGATRNPADTPSQEAKSLRGEIHAPYRLKN